ncbi:MAG: NUDIX hydrolase N-terminal domain-containing protein [Burkholderiaceae bacterium]
MSGTDRPAHLLDLLEELRAIAQTGLGFSRHPFDRVRYEHLMQVVSREYAALTDLSAEQVSERLRAELGYATPKVGVSAAVFDEQGRLLLVNRVQDQTWCLPGGWAEVRMTPEQSCAKEVVEESGLQVEVGPLIRIRTRLPGEFASPHTSFHLLYACRRIGGELAESIETTEPGFYDIDEPRPWHLDQHEEARTALVHWQANTGWYRGGTG